MPDDDDLLYRGAIVPGRFGFLDLEPSQLRERRVLAELDNGEPLEIPDHERGHMYVCGATRRGKTRFLANLLMQDLHHGRPVCVLDPGGELYEYARAYVARCRTNLLRSEPPVSPEELGRVISRFLFLDISDPDNPIRLNPLVVQPPENEDEAFDDLMRTVERVTQREFMEQRKIREVLGSTFRLLIQLNQLPESARPQPPPFGFGYPVGLHLAHRFLDVDPDADAERERIITAIPPTVSAFAARDYWLRTFVNKRGTERDVAVASSRRVLDFFVDVGCVGRHFFSTATNTLDVAALLRDNISLFADLRQGTTSEGVGLVGTFLANKLERAASRRGTRQGVDWLVPYTLYLDEFQRFCDPVLAEHFTQIRKLGLRIVCAHQNTVQEPFDDDRGRSMLTTIVSMCNLRVIFGIDASSANRLVDDLLPVTHRVVKRTETEVRRTHGTSFAVTDGGSDTRSESRSDATQESTTRSHNDSTSRSYPFMGVIHDRSAIGDAQSWQQQTGSSHTDTRGSAHQESHSQTRTDQESQTDIKREVFASGEEERQLMRQELQQLRPRECVIAAGGPNGIRARAYFMPSADHISPALSFDPVARLMADQKERLELLLPVIPLIDALPPTSAKRKRTKAASQSRLPFQGDVDPDHARADRLAEPDDHPYDGWPREESADDDPFGR